MSIILTLPLKERVMLYSYDANNVNTSERRQVNRNLQELLLKLLRRWKRSFTVEKWQRHLVKFAFFCSDVDGWELEKFGFPRCKLSTKLRIIKNLLEVQFDTNTKFKEKINEKSSQELRFSPLGRDKNGLAYWYLIDKEFNLRIYREEQDDVEAETWEMVVSDRNSLVGLIGRLVQEQDKSRSATPSSQDGENSQDGSLPLKPASKESQTSGVPEKTKLACEASDAKPDVGTVKQEPSDVKLEGETLKQEPSEVKLEGVAVKQEPSDIKAEDGAVKHESVEVKSEDAVLPRKESIKTEEHEEKLDETNDKAGNATEEEVDAVEQLASDGDTRTAGDQTVVQIKTEPCEDTSNDHANELPVDKSQTTDGFTEQEQVARHREREAHPQEHAEKGEEKDQEATIVQKDDGAEDGMDKRSNHAELSEPASKVDANDNDEENVTQQKETVAKEDKTEARSDVKQDKTSESELKCKADHLSSEQDAKENVTLTEDVDQSTKKESEEKCDEDAGQEQQGPVKEASLVENTRECDVTSENSSEAETELKAEPEDSRVGRKESDAERTETPQKGADGRSESGTGDVPEVQHAAEVAEGDEGRDKTDGGQVESLPDELSQGDSCVNLEESSQLVNKQDKEIGKSDGVSSNDEAKEGMESKEVNETNTRNCETTVDKADSQKMTNKVEDSRATKDVTSADGSHSRRKRGRDDERRELTAKSDIESNDESEISDSQTDLSSEVNSDEPPSKKKRDKMLKKASSRTRRRQMPEGDNSTEERNTDEQLFPMKKHQPEGEEPVDKTKTDVAETKADGTELIEDRSQSGSDKENVKKRGRGVGIVKEEASDYEPSSKKGRPAVGSLGRGRGRGRPKVPGPDRSTPSQHDGDDSDDVPLVQLRRSARRNKGQRVIEPLYTIEEPRRKQSKKAQEQEEQRLKKQAENGSKRSRKDKKKDKKKKKRDKYDSDDDFVPGKNGYKKRCRRRNASYSDDSNDDDDDLFEEEEDVSSLHFSPSSSEVEIDCDSEEYQPTGRNAKRALAICNKKSDEEQEFIDDDASCCKCGKGNHPELILLCDKCDSGYHTACLRPPLMIIPDGDWYCPPCEHLKLIENLQNQLRDLDTQMKAKERLVKRKERLAYVGISLDNILPDHGEKEDGIEEEDVAEVARQKRRERHKRQREREYYPWEIETQYKMTRGYREYSDSESQASESPSQSESDEDEQSTPEEEHWLVMRRSRRERKEISYKFDEYDNIINSAIKEQVQEVEGTAAEEVQPADENDEPSSDQCGTNVSTVVPATRVTHRPRSGGKDMSNIPGFREEEQQSDGRPPPVVRKRKKTRRLTALDSDAAEDGDDSDEYKASDDTLVSDYEDEIPSEDSVSDDWIVENYRKQSRRSAGTRRSRRKRGRRKWDDDFVVDNDYDSEDDDSCYRRTRRCVSRRQISYREDSGSDSQASGYTSRRSRRPAQSRHKRVIVAESGDDNPRGTRTSRASKRDDDDDDSASDGRAGGRSTGRSKEAPRSRRKRVIVADSADDDDDEDERQEDGDGAGRWSRRKRYSDDSEYTPSDDSERSGYGRASASRKLNYRDMIGSDSDENGDAEPAKRKRAGLLDVGELLGSVAGGGGGQTQTAAAAVSRPDRGKPNGLPKDGGDDIEAVLTDASKLVGAVVQPEQLDDVPLDDDDLDDVDDLVSYVTQE